MENLCERCKEKTEAENTARRYSFFKNEDRHDLFEYIKKINPNVEMIDDVSQNLLNAIETKCADINYEIWNSVVTLSVSGSPSSGKSSILEKILQVAMPGFMVVEINSKEHYIRFAKIR